MNGQRDGQTDRRMDRWTDRQTNKTDFRRRCPSNVEHPKVFLKRILTMKL